MSTIEKLKKRLLSRPKDFSMEELDRLLLGLGYVRLKHGKTTGSKVGYMDPENGRVFSLHKPHPENVLKPYVVRELIAHLEKDGRL